MMLWVALTCGILISAASAAALWWSKPVGPSVAHQLPEANSNPNPAPAVISNPAPSRPRYEPADLSEILTALREMRGIIEKMPTFEEAEAIRWSWTKAIKRDGGAADMAVKLKDIGDRILIGMNALDKLTEVDHKHYSAELHPIPFTAIERQYVGAYSGTCGQLASDLNDLARAPEINIEKWTLPVFNEWQNNLHPKYLEWIGRSNSRITIATKEFREWKNQ